MRMVGFCGGDLIRELGYSGDMEIFYSCIHRYVTSKDIETNYSLIVDKLYRRYLKREELDDALRMMDNIENIFKTITSQSVDWVGLGLNIEETYLDISEYYLHLVFRKYFNSFRECVNSYRHCYDKYKDNNVVKTIFTDPVWFTYENLRTLSEYDEHDGIPFWWATKENSYGIKKPTILRKDNE
ncbi:MAG: hypothetical protein IPP74_06860 [Alphaproteobacteria bacterium]|nr:hypothetical protein [Alphaproteobacteria bacterium]